MPELPEVECVRRSLLARILGRRIRSVRVIRPDIITGQASPAALLNNQHITQILRHGKQLALVSDAGRCVVVHLGMSGQLCFVDPAHNRGTKASSPELPPHTHLKWHIDDGPILRFTDPRRFGGLWTYPNIEELERERWSTLGPDALEIKPNDLLNNLLSTRRGLKAALLDQHLIAGLGNIYVDELLHATGLHPSTCSRAVDNSTCSALVRRMRSLLNQAINRGGSSLRDYVDADSRRGSQQTHHRVYGRAGEICKNPGCGSTILSEVIAGRTTAWCPSCQPLRG